jgi:uncharacterized damage-inducible protein DinB
MKRTKWFDRKFPAIGDNGLLPPIIERLAGTPARLDEISKGLNADQLHQKPEGKWSVQEEIGHLSDIEPLWLDRVDDLLGQASALRAADLTNRKTHDANHNAADLNALLWQFREQRGIFVKKLRSLDDGQLEHTALHPRLKTPMRIIDLAFFVAEHDDHHLACIREIVTELS